MMKSSLISDKSSLQEMITTPTLLVDKTRCLENIRRMCQKARDAKCRLRPHFKTHASLSIARWFQEIDPEITAITVSSVSMAEYFCKDGDWKDITIAFPINILELRTIERLLTSHPDLQLNLLVENTEAVEALETRLKLDNKDNNRKVGIFLKIDVGYGRTGIPAEETDRIDAILQRLKSSKQLEFLGFLTHSGHTYHCRSSSISSAREQVQAIFQTTKDLMVSLKQAYADEFPNLQLSMGDTPCCSVVPANEFKGVFDEMRPGNFVFYDLEQAEIGACNWEDISVAVACPIVAKHVDRRELVLYGGGVHCSKERLVVAQDESGGRTKTIYGRVVRQSSSSWLDVIDGMYLRSLSQEHGIVVVPSTEDMDQYKIGDLVYVLPIHSCMAADCLKHKGYLSTDGQVLERMKN